LLWGARLVAAATSKAIVLALGILHRFMYLTLCRERSSEERWWPFSSRSHRRNPETLVTLLVLSFLSLGWRAGIVVRCRCRWCWRSVHIL